MYFRLPLGQVRWLITSGTAPTNARTPIGIVVWVSELSLSCGVQTLETTMAWKLSKRSGLMWEGLLLGMPTQNRTQGQCTVLRCVLVWVCRF